VVSKDGRAFSAHGYSELSRNSQGVQREGWDEMLLLSRSGEHRAAGRQNLGQLQRWGTKTKDINWECSSGGASLPAK